jgi:tetratricopeptide (TPR) repeat protein
MEGTADEAVCRATPETPEAWNLYGANALREGRSDVAVEAIRRAIQLDPACADYRCNLGIVFRSRNELGAAEQSFREAIALRPEFFEALRHLGSLLAESGKDSEAIARLELARQLAADSDPLAKGRVLARLAPLYQRNSRPEQAIAAWRRLAELFPDRAASYSNLGTALLESGRARESVAEFERALALDSSSAHAWTGLANALSDVGDTGGAIAAYERAVGLQPRDAIAINNLGTLLQGLGKTDDALRCFRHAVAARPDYAIGHNNLGSILLEQRQLGEALACFRRALELDPGFAEACVNLASVFNELDRAADAAVYCRRAVQLAPASAETLIRSGVELAKADLHGEAEALYRRALELKPESPSTLFNLGNALREQKKLAEAEECYRQALQRKPDYPEALNNLALVVGEMGSVAEAESLCIEALRLNPDYAEAEYNRGNALKQQDRFYEALDCYRRAIAIRPDFADAHINLAYLLMEDAIRRSPGSRPDFSEAKECYLSALAIGTHSPQVHVNLALLLLLQGDFEAGWTEYEWRWKTKDTPAPDFGQPVWDGSPFPGRTLLLYSEQGYGDTIQFIRFAAEAKKRGGTVLGLCPPELKDLLRGVEGIDRWFTTGDPIAPFDLRAPLMSLPRILNAGPGPAAVPYLNADPRLVEAFTDRFKGLGPLRVGFAWRGNPQHKRDALRSIPLGFFERFAAMPGISMVSLQKGEAVRELETWKNRFPVLELGSGLSNFAETAAAITQLDLVMGCDTSIVHLAGALGRPVWIFLPLLPDWRWQTNRSDSDWYPSARLFRQENSGDWDAPFRSAGAAWNILSH